MTRQEGAWLWLSLVKGLSAGKARTLVDFFGGIEEIWDASSDQLIEAAGVGIAGKLLAQRKPDGINEHVKKCRQLGFSIVTPAHEAYPPLLLETFDPPCALYAIGDISLLKSDCLAVIGTRRPTRYGQKVTRKLAGELAEAGLVIVSGLAEGLDAAAHRAALDAGGKTIAVLGNGLDVFYPSNNSDLQKEIALRGLVISEYAPGVRGSRATFPARNRIIAGMCRGVLVTEAGEKSGTMITAGIAMDCGRELFTVPGNIDSPSSTQTNRLMHTSAEIVLEASDVLGVLGMDAPQAAMEAKPAKPALDNDERIIVDYIGHEPQSFDQLIVLTGFSAAKLNSLLTMLQLKGIIDQSAGRVFALKS